MEANVVCCQLDKVAHASCDEQREVNTAVDAFMAMAQELQTVANDCAPLMEATIGMFNVPKPILHAKANEWSGYS